MFKEFKEFATRGNVIDLAVGVIVGAAFGKIVASVVNDIVMPPFGLILGRVNFADLYINLSGRSYRSLSEAKLAEAPVIGYGAFINNVIEFLIIAFVLFLFVKQINKLRRSPANGPSEKECPYCFSKISIKATRCPNCTSKMD